MRPAAMAVGLLAAVFVFAGSAAPPTEARAVRAASVESPDIVGGTAATENYSFMASMQGTKDGDPNCGASLIKPDWLVTAAHCVNGQEPAQWRYRIGSTDRTTGGELAVPDQFVTHPKYDPTDTGDYDIALVHLARSVTAKPVPIATRSPAHGTAIRELGWGLTCPKRGCGAAPTSLRQVDTSVVTDASCGGKDSPFDPARELCLDNNGGRASTCFGDSGGPALVFTARGWSLAGVTSRGQTLACPERPGIFTDVSAHAAWIAEQTSAR
ncbi:MAG: S1 family peptidase [Sciscionella sp.]